MAVAKAALMEKQTEKEKISGDWNQTSWNRNEPEIVWVETAVRVGKPDRDIS